MSFPRLLECSLKIFRRGLKVNAQSSACKSIHCLSPYPGYSLKSLKNGVTKGGGWPPPGPFVQKRLGNVEEAKDKDKNLQCDPQKILHFNLHSSEFSTYSSQFDKRFRIRKCFKIKEFRILIWKLIKIDFFLCSILGQNLDFWHKKSLNCKSCQNWFLGQKLYS